MSTSNGVNSDSFSRSDVIKTYQVVQYFGGILTQYPIVTNIDYNNITGMITANGITSVQATSGTAQASLSIKGADSNSATRPGASVNITAGNGTGGGAAGSVVIRSGRAGNSSATTFINLSNETLSISGGGASSLRIDAGGLSVTGGYNDAGDINFVAGYNAAITSGRPIIFATDSGNIFEMWEETLGTQKIGFFGKTPLAAKPTVSGSRGGNVALKSVIDALVALGLVNDSTT